ncbi:MAG: metal-dependent transcriptional regulator [Planctomycetota bacterium]
MLRTLADSGLADYQAYEGVRLTEMGTRLALRILRRHRLIEPLLEQTLGLTWDEVHEEAEHLEHAVSDRLIDRIDQFLQFPAMILMAIRFPIGWLPDVHANEPLACFHTQTPFILERVLDQSPEFLVPQPIGIRDRSQGSRDREPSLLRGARSSSGRGYEYPGDERQRRNSSFAPGAKIDAWTVVRGDANLDFVMGAPLEPCDQPSIKAALASRER